MNKRQHRQADDHHTACQPVQAVDHVDRIDRADDHKHRDEKSKDWRQRNHERWRKCQGLRRQSRKGNRTGTAHELSRESKFSRQRLKVVEQPDKKDQHRARENSRQCRPARPKNIRDEKAEKNGDAAKTRNRRRMYFAPQGIRQVDPAVVRRIANDERYRDEANPQCRGQHQNNLQQRQQGHHDCNDLRET